MPALAKRYRVHAFDLPGHGLSAASPVGSLDETVDAIAARMPARAAVCGWSLGGLVAQRLAQRHAPRIASLVLLSTTPCFVARPGWAHGIKDHTLETFANGLLVDRERTLTRFVALNALHGAHSREAVRAFTAKLFERGAPTAAALGASLGWLRDTDLRVAAPQLPRGTLILHGGRDMLAPIRAARWLAAAAPAARIVEWPDAAHLPLFSHRDAFVHALESAVA
jgi:pimeloyl-[acyl-carrier protein] methyl ester esterase